MDVGTLTRIRDALVRNEVAADTRRGSISDLTFRAEVKGRRYNKAGCRELLVQWEPKDMWDIMVKSLQNSKPKCSLKIFVNPRPRVHDVRMPLDKEGADLAL